MFSCVLLNRSTSRKCARANADIDAADVQTTANSSGFSVVYMFMSFTFKDMIAVNIMTMHSIIKLDSFRRETVRKKIIFGNIV